MKKKLKINYSSKHFGRYPSLLTTSKYQNEERNLKPAEEWIYGTLNKIGSDSTINFKNQKAFKGYQKQKIDLCKSFYFLIFFLML